jgi:hypothetical protein
MRPARRLAFLAALIAVVTGLAGCRGEPGDEARAQLERGFSSDDIREGLAVPVDGVRYTVFITRQLNPHDPEDSQYYKGPEPKPGRIFYGVFIQACVPEEADGGRPTARHFEIEDTLGDKYKPKPLPKENVFAYRPTKLAPGVCIPNQASATAYSPTGGAMLLFDLPVAAAENRPLELSISAEWDPVKNRRQTAKFELDI